MADLSRKPPPNLKFPERKWVFGLEGVKDKQELIPVRGIVEPTGQLVSRDEVVKNESEEAKREKKKAFAEKIAWDKALAPGKQIPMMGFMMWMMGSQVNIFTLMFMFYQLFTPIKGLMGLNSAFAGISDNGDFLQQKLVFIACQLGCLLMIVHRLGSMGLLPTAAGDWLTAVPIKSPIEFASGGFPMHDL